MTGAQELILQGKKIGRKEGREEGKAEGREEGKVVATQTVLLRLGSKRFGPPDEKIAMELTAITSLDRLEGLVERVLDVESWSELLSTE